MTNEHKNTRQGFDGYTHPFDRSMWGGVKNAIAAVHAGKTVGVKQLERTLEQVEKEIDHQMKNGVPYTEVKHLIDHADDLVEQIDAVKFGIRT